MLVALYVLIYAFFGGLIGCVAYRAITQRCPDCNRTSRKGYCIDFHGVPASIAGALWPLALPVACGMWVGERAANHEERTKRAEAKHARRMAEINAQRELAREQKEKTMADIKFLVENGINAEVPGLYDGGS